MRFVSGMVAGLALALAGTSCALVAGLAGDATLLQPDAGTGGAGGASSTSSGAGGGCVPACTNMHGTAQCTGGQCVPSCTAGYGDCDSTPSNGCETPLTTITNCGACGTVCTAAPVTCKDEACYNYEWAEWPMPNSAGLPNPEGYAPGSSGVLDNVTGLLWQEPIDGNDMLGQNCSGGCSQTQAVTYCSSLTFGGFSDWRLPTYVELVSLLDYSLQSSPPLINHAAFPSTPQSFFWASTPFAASPTDGWIVGFGNGFTNVKPVIGGYSVRCVR